MDGPVDGFPLVAPQPVPTAIMDLQKITTPPPRNIDTTKTAHELAGYYIGTTDKPWYEEEDDSWLGPPVRPDPKAKDHAVDFAKHVGGKLTGKGLAADPHHISQHILHILASSHRSNTTQDLMHAYVHGKVPKKRPRPFRHKPADILAEHNETLSHVGGRLRYSSIRPSHILLI